MATTEVGLVNQALAQKLGVETIVALTGTDKTSVKANLVYPQVRDSLLERFDWSFCKKRVQYSSKVDALAGKLRFEDDFSDNSLNTGKWLVNDVQGFDFVLEQNNRLEVQGSGIANDAGISSIHKEDISDRSIGLALNENLVAICDISCDPAGTQVDAYAGFSGSEALDSTFADGLGIYFKNDGTFSIFLNGSEITTEYEYRFQTKYRIKIIYVNPGWEVYVESEEDSDYDNPVLIYETTTDSTGPMYFHFNILYGVIYLDDVRVLSEYIPPFEYELRYPLPSDCVRVTDVNGSTSNYVVEGGYLYISDESIDLKYIAKETDVSKYTEPFQTALISAIASALAIALKGDYSLSQNLEDRVDRILLPRAMRLDASERHPYEKASQTQDTPAQSAGRS